MLADQRALLDQLMGKHRNVLPEERVVAKKWDDRSMCSYYLVDFCPHDLFTNTKSDLGPCTYEHDEDAKAEFAKVEPRRKYNMETRFIRFLEKLIDDCDHKVLRGKERLKKTDEQGSEVNKEKTAHLTALIQNTFSQIEALAEAGNVFESQKLVPFVEALTLEKKELEKTNVKGGAQEFRQQSGQVILVDKEMQCCEVCGCITVVSDSERMSAIPSTGRKQHEHLGGKQHTGYEKIRATLELYKKKKAEERLAQEEEKSAREKVQKQYENADKGTDKDRQGKDKDPHRDRDRDRGSDERRPNRTQLSNDRASRSRSRPRSRDSRRSRSRESIRKSSRPGERRSRESTRYSRVSARRSRSR